MICYLMSVFRSTIRWESRKKGVDSREIYGFRAILISKMALTIKNDSSIMEKTSIDVFFILCAEHGANLTGASPVTGIYRQV